jgi:carbon-monoxide dehydrogenase medium subunit
MGAYLGTRDLNEALAWLHEHQDEAVVVAGGTTVSPFLEPGAPPPAILDLSRIEELRGIEEDSRVLRVGSMVTLANLVEWVDQRAIGDRIWEGIGHVTRHIADPVIRYQATVGGNVGRGGELALLGLALDGALVVSSHARGVQVVPLADRMIAGAGALIEPDELILAVEIPRGRIRHLEYRKFTWSHLASIPLVNAAASQTVDGSYRLAVGSLHLYPFRLTAAEVMLSNRSPSLPIEDASVVEDVVNQVLRTLEVTGNDQVSADYRRYMTGVLLRAVLQGSDAVGEL